MAFIDVYNERITIYGTVDSSFVEELTSQYSGYEVEYVTDSIFTLAY